MIYTDLKSLPNYFSHIPNLKTAFDFLTENMRKKLSEGRHSIDGDNVFALVSYPGNSLNTSATLEAHRNYIDIHIAAEGSELIGWKDLSSCTQLLEEYNSEKDVTFFQDKDHIALPISNETLMLFLPHDCHAPGLHCKDLIKIVIKIKITNS